MKRHLRAGDGSCKVRIELCFGQEDAFLHLFCLLMAVLGSANLPATSTQHEHAPSAQAVAIPGLASR